MTPACATPCGVAVDAAGDVFIADTSTTGWWSTSPTARAATRRAWSMTPACRLPRGWRSTGPGTCSSPTPATTGWSSTRRCTRRRRSPALQTAGSLTVAFTDASTAVSPATITGWSWNFGDGSPASTAPGPQRIPTRAPGTYTVSLTVTDSNGQTSTATQQQVTVAAVHASLTYPTTGQTDVSTVTPFRWADIPAGQGYQLWIGTSRGDGSLLKSGVLSASTSSYQVPALPTGVKLWARLYTEVAGDWGNYAGHLVHGDRQPGRVHLPDRRPAEHRHAHPVQLESRDRRAGLPADDRHQTRRGGSRELRDPRARTSPATACRRSRPARRCMPGSLRRSTAAGATIRTMSFTAAPNPVAFTHPTQGQTGVSTPATFTWSTSPAATGYQLWVGTRRGYGSLLKSGLLTAQHLLLPAPGAPGRPDTLGPDLHRGRQRLGQLAGHHVHHRRRSRRRPRAANRRRTITHQLTATAAHQPTPAWMRRLLRLEPDLHHPRALTRPNPPIPRMAPRVNNTPMTPSSRCASARSATNAPLLRVAGFHNRSAREVTDRQLDQMTSDS